jgi:hypothetical protein
MFLVIEPIDVLHQNNFLNVYFQLAVFLRILYNVGGVAIVVVVVVEYVYMIVLWNRIVVILYDSFFEI